MATKPKPKPAPKPVAKKVTKKQMLMDLISQPHGASMNELEQAVGWARPTIRAVISTEKRKAGLTVELAEGRYCIVKPD